MPKSYGFFMVSGSRHVSSDCPAVKRARLNPNVLVREYPSSRTAAGAGHIRGCRFCGGGKVFEVGAQSKVVQVSDYQHAALKNIVAVFEKKGPMTLRDIAARRGTSVVAAYLIVKRLEKIGLVSQKRKIGSMRASGGTLAPTELGLELCKTLPAEDWKIPLD